ncbi:hybrid sensor histidine kinase/response regulator [Ramlibacter rhizophilus]|uniref:histidine kinase n=1 Tax=Ramlibacter rhizophilus TaxID=1781167 RepID=A0A4Z0C0I3_9BURK|nr:response regulator [Ramlibacter rhizophilus]TFZ05043.1 response regulator [Ramlibacter rhizophilus]
MTHAVAHPAAAADRQDGRVNILIVDDLLEKHVVFRSVLEELGENVVSARSGREALAHVLNSEFAVILLDVNMPDIDGLETASLIRQYKRSAQTPIVFITAYVDELQAKRGYALGAVDYIPSPVVPEVLRSKVKVFVDLYRMHRQLQLRAVEREALARAEAARAAAEAATERADYLSEASRRLGGSLDLNQTAAALLELAVPRLGAQALLVASGFDGSVAVLNAHPAAAAACELAQGLRVAVLSALHDGRMARWQDGTDAALVFPLREGEPPRRALILRGPEDRFDPPAVALATEIVGRASIAMENARLYAAVQQADRRKNEFLAMLAHELRNPLAPIRNAVHIMQGGEVPASTLHWARDVISRQADHMTRLIDDLLDVSRIVQGKVVVRPERLSLSNLVERSVEASAPTIASRGQQLKVSLPEEPVALMGDGVRLAQVVSNLVNNASKFSPAGSAIELGASFDGSQVTLRVRDKGCGIDPAFLPHIFDLFVQGDQTLDRAQGGLGIGLTLVKHLVELHGGQVEARSEGSGTGAEFLVRLPAQPGEAAAAPQPGPIEVVRPGAAQGSSSRVLVVDDLAASAETLTLLLEMEGYRVRVAPDGPTALRVAEEFRPDAVLLDIGLPGMNGFEVAQRLRQQPSGIDTLLIALTGYGEAESRHRSAEAGFDFHMVKPADVDLLLSLVADPQKARQVRAG